MGTLIRESQLQLVIGRPALKALVKIFPGRRISVPGLSPEHMARFRENFAPLIGSDKVEALFEYFGGTRITIPTHRVPGRGRGFLPVSLARVVDLTENGLTAQQIARILQCEPRSVHKARTKARRLGMFNLRKPKVRA